MVLQCFIDGKGFESDALERKLYVIRKVIERSAKKIIGDNDIFYIPSMSCRTIIYKGLFTAGDMRQDQSLVVKAIADGRRVAQGIQDYLTKRK